MHTYHVFLQVSLQRSPELATPYQAAKLRILTTLVLSVLFQSLRIFITFVARGATVILHTREES